VLSVVSAERGVERDAALSARMMMRTTERTRRYKDVFRRMEGRRSWRGEKERGDDRG
jgi:hypothetical protein